MADLVSKNSFPNFGHQMWEMDAMEATQGGSDTHNDPHETGAVQTAARPSLYRKTILLTIKSFSTSDYIEINNSFLVKLNFTGWDSCFLLTFSCLKKIAKHFRKNPSETVVCSISQNKVDYSST